MKKIINGKKYDTTTAAEVGSWSNGYGRNDFSHISQTLYRKRTGEYFLYGEGGPMTCYARKCGENSWSGGEGIRPLTKEMAMEWAENSLEVAEHEKEFGEVSE